MDMQQLLTLCSMATMSAMKM